MRFGRKWRLVCTSAVLAVALPVLVSSGNSAAEQRRDGDPSSAREWVGSWATAVTGGEATGISRTGFTDQSVSVGDSLYIRSHRPDGVPVEVKARVVRVAPGNYGTTRVGVAVTETKENWLRLFVAWIADDNVEVEEEV